MRACGRVLVPASRPRAASVFSTCTWTRSLAAAVDVPDPPHPPAVTLTAVSRRFRLWAAVTNCHQQTLKQVPETTIDRNSPGQNRLLHDDPLLLQHVGRLGSEPRLVGRIGSGVRVSASFQNISAGFCPTASERGYELTRPRGQVFVRGVELTSLRMKLYLSLQPSGPTFNCLLRDDRVTCRQQGPSLVQCSRLTRFTCVVICPQST